MRAQTPWKGIETGHCGTTQEESFIEPTSGWKDDDDDVMNGSGGGGDCDGFDTDVERSGIESGNRVASGILDNSFAVNIGNEDEEAGR